MGRPPKPAAEKQSGRLFFVSEPWRADLYRKIVAERFNGNFSAFARMACDALADQLGYSVRPPND